MLQYGADFYLIDHVEGLANVDLQEYSSCIAATGQ